VGLQLPAAAQEERCVTEGRVLVRAAAAREAAQKACEPVPVGSAAARMGQALRAGKVTAALRRELL